MKLEYTQMTKFFTKLRNNEAGATAIEYGLIAALIAVAAIATMTSIGTNLDAQFQKVNTGLTTTTTP